MGNVYYLDQPTATTMTSLNGLLKLYRCRNVGGKFDAAIEKYKAIYDGLMSEVLDTAA